MSNQTTGQESNVLYQYRQCGLDNVYLDGGFEEVNSPYGKSVRVVDVDGLHKVIAEILVRKKANLTGAEFKFLRTELDLSQSAMGALCGTNDRTIRQWESNEAVDDPANTIIRVVYEQRFLDPAAKFEDVAAKIKAFQAADKRMHELKLGMCDNRWKEAA